MMILLLQHPVEARFGTCYSPFHSDAYPFDGAPDATARLKSIMTQDFAQISAHTSIIRTYYASFYGQDVASVAHAAGLQVVLGVYLKDDALAELEIAAAIAAVRDYPETVVGILVGSENLADTGSGRWTPLALVDIISRIRRGVGGPQVVNIGTAQRINEWLNDDKDMDVLASACDIIGVNIYPFFSQGWTSSSPLVSLDAQWNQMAARYPRSKLRVTESGFPTAGTAPVGLPLSIPSLENGEVYYRAFYSWTPPRDDDDDHDHAHFLFQFFDRHPKDNAPAADYERHFGIADRFGNPKFSLFEVADNEVSRSMLLSRALPTSESDVASQESTTSAPESTLVPETPALETTSALETPAPAPENPVLETSETSVLETSAPETSTPILCHRRLRQKN